ncbi:MAG: type II secretion system protein [Vicinamibacterales bacterium]
MRIRNAQGFALIDILFVCGIIGILSLIAMPRLLMARQAAGAASAIGSMRTINSAQLTYALTCGGGFYAPRLTVLGTPPPSAVTAYISPTLGRDDAIIQSGYNIQMTATPFPGSPVSCNGLGSGEAGQGFKAGADPLEATNSRYFSINANGQIWEHSASLFATMPEFGEAPAGHVLR